MEVKGMFKDPLTRVVNEEVRVRNRNRTAIKYKELIPPTQCSKTPDIKIWCGKVDIWLNLGCDNNVIVTNKLCFLSMTAAIRKACINQA